MEQIMVTAPRKIEIRERALDQRTFGPERVCGRTLYSLVSAGTETNYVYLPGPGAGKASGMGYSAVFEAEYVGANVSGIRKGDLVFCRGSHQSYQCVDARAALKVPAGLAPEKALFARMAGVSMATLSRTRIAPADNVLVSGLGMVGVMAMQAYANCGYRVVGVEPNARRAALLRRPLGQNVLERFPAEGEPLFGQIGLALECSGTQQATRSCAEVVRSGGEISLVGVPWVQTGDVQSFETLNRIFYRYLTVYSGWEMNLPDRVAPFGYGGQLDNFELALGWLAEGKMSVDGLYAVYPYTAAQAVYEGIVNRTEEKISVVFDWRDAKGEVI